MPEEVAAFNERRETREEASSTEPNILDCDGLEYVKVHADVLRNGPDETRKEPHWQLGTHFIFLGDMWAPPPAKGGEAVFASVNILLVQAPAP